MANFDQVDFSRQWAADIISLSTLSVSVCIVYKVQTVEKLSVFLMNPLHQEYQTESMRISGTPL